MKRLGLFLSIASLVLIVGCGSDTVGSNPEMPPADQRPKTNRVDPPGATTGTEPQINRDSG